MIKNAREQPSGAGFSLWGLRLARTKPHRLKPAPLIALISVLFFASCGNRVDPAAKPKPQPPPPFEFLSSWGDKGDGPGKLDQPVSFATDTLGNVFFADPGAGFVHKFESNGTPLLSFEEPGVRHAAGIAVDAGGAIYLTNARQGTILVFFPDGTFFQSWRGAAERHLSGPIGIGIDEQGTLYVPDNANSRVLKFSNHGRLLRSWRAPEKPSSPDERPSWISAEPDDSLFVAYFDTGRIEKFASDGTSITSWPTSATPASETGPITGFAMGGDFVFTMRASSSEVRVFTKDGQHKLDADLGASLGKIAAPQIVATTHSEFLVFDPSVPKVFRFRLHLKDPELNQETK